MNMINFLNMIWDFLKELGLSFSVDWAKKLLKKSVRRLHFGFSDNKGMRKNPEWYRKLMQRNKIWGRNISKEQEKILIRLAEKFHIAFHIFKNGAFHFNDQNNIIPHWDKKSNLLNVFYSCLGAICLFSIWGLFVFALFSPDNKIKMICSGYMIISFVIFLMLVAYTRKNFATKILYNKLNKKR